MRLSDILVPIRNSFGALRLFAALTVAGTHAIEIKVGNVYWDPAYIATGYTLGQHAVHVFFILSGLLVTASLVRSEGLSQFALARFLRIFPGLTVCALLTALVMGAIVTICPTVSYFMDSGVGGYVVKTVFLITGRAELPGVFADNPLAGQINNSVWTLKYEVMCYAALGLLSVLGLASKRVPALTSVGVVLLVLVGTFVVDGVIAEATPLDVIRRFAICFCLGSMAYFARERLVISGATLAVAVAGAYLLWGSAMGVPALLVFEAYLVLWVASLTCERLANFTHRHDLSFGIYLYGWPISQSLLQLIPELAPGWLAVLTFGLAFPVAALSWHLVELPAQRLGRSLRQSVAPRPHWALMQLADR